MTERDTNATSPIPTNEKAMVPILKDSLLVVFIHGFKGTDETFLEFPQRLHNILGGTLDNVQNVECILFPAYETKGELNEAVVRFADWLTTLTVEKEVASGGGAGSTKIVLCGHSMGGLLAADTLLEFIKSRPDPKAPLWPKIIACLAFDTPYLGLHPYVFKNSFSKAAEYANAAKSVGSAIFGSLAGFGSEKAAEPSTSLPVPPPSEKTGWAKWVPAAYTVGGAVLAGAAAGGAYWRREDLGVGYTWATDHMKYVKNLWDTKALDRRVDALIDAEDQDGVTFRTFYTLIPPTPPVYVTPRTFIVLPRSKDRSSSYFLPAQNSKAPDELQAHTGMFSAATNDGYYDLGLQTAKFIREALLLSHGIFDDSIPDALPHAEPSHTPSETPESQASAH